VLGAICGDIIGSVYEQENLKSKDFPLFQKSCKFTDDSVLTCALADSLLHDLPFVENLKKFYHFYPNAGFGYMFSKWALSEEKRGYFSYGNGSAMRVSPIAWAFDSLDEVCEMAKASAAVTHNHPEGINGAVAVAGAIFLARNNTSRQDIKDFAIERGYDLDFTLEAIRPAYCFDATCQNSVPQAIVAFLESDNFEDAIRNAISIGGDSDTIACMAGSIAEAFYRGVPTVIREEALTFLDERLRGIFDLFEEKHLSLYDLTPYASYR